LFGKKIVQHTNYGNAQPVKSKRLIGGAPTWPKTGLLLNIDNPIWPIMMALPARLQKLSSREQNCRKLFSSFD
jgi:hypothetical protein